MVEVLAILAQTFTCKRCLCIPTLIDLALPTLVRLCGRAKTNQRRERHKEHEGPKRKRAGLSFPARHGYRMFGVGW
jgi:hypothetical protein